MNEKEVIQFQQLWPEVQLYAVSWGGKVYGFAELIGDFSLILGTGMPLSVFERLVKEGV